MSLAPYAMDVARTGGRRYPEPPHPYRNDYQRDELMRRQGDRFDHNLHALRIVERFEQRYAAFPGLNLTFEVREGIIKHSRDYQPEAGAPGAHSEADSPELADYRLAERPPLEAQLIDLADEIAYNSADLDDGYEAKLLERKAMAAEVPLYAGLADEVARLYPLATPKLHFNEVLKRIINHLTTDLIEHTRRVLAEKGIDSVEAVRRAPARLVSFSPEGAAANRALKQFLWRRLYSQPQINEERERAVKVVEELFELYLTHPDRLPPQYFEQTKREAPHRVVCDYIAGMTDNYIFRVHQEAFATIRSQN